MFEGHLLQKSSTTATVIAVSRDFLSTLSLMDSEIASSCFLHFPTPCLSLGLPLQTNLNLLVWKSQMSVSQESDGCEMNGTEDGT